VQKRTRNHSIKCHDVEKSANINVERRTSVVRSKEPAT
jgi:hypothetical protein